MSFTYNKQQQRPKKEKRNRKRDRDFCLVFRYGVPLANLILKIAKMILQFWDNGNS